MLNIKSIKHGDAELAMREKKSLPHLKKMSIEFNQPKKNTNGKKNRVVKQNTFRTKGMCVRLVFAKIIS